MLKANYALNNAVWLIGCHGFGELINSLKLINSLRKNVSFRLSGH